MYPEDQLIPISALQHWLYCPRQCAETDSLRFYHPGENWKHRVEHHGAKAGYDVDGPLII